MSQRLIPYIKPSRKVVLFEPDKVREALARFEVKAVGQGVNRKKDEPNRY
jgi:hypothetical protein